MYCPPKFNTHYYLMHIRERQPEKEINPEMRFTAHSDAERVIGNLGKRIEYTNLASSKIDKEQMKLYNIRMSNKQSERNFQIRSALRNQMTRMFNSECHHKTMFKSLISYANFQSHSLTNYKNDRPQFDDPTMYGRNRSILNFNSQTKISQSQMKKIQDEMVKISERRTLKICIRY